ncbi:MAG: ThiF family adenylyltransferase, partial [Gemmatimonadetes bacterium]|nr:ThiF family adenylyltransferase [Gemmatimonadota bacterium]
MPVIVHIPSPLRPYVGGRDRVEVEAKTVAEVLERLTTEHDQLKTHLFKDDGTVRGFVNLFLNNRDIRDMSEGDTPTADGDELSIVPSIAGGATTVRSELPELSQEEILRYSRHLILPEVGLEGQRRLKAARIVLVGTGGLGSPAALYLAAAGVGTLGLIDFDTVEVTNLQRQIIHGTSTVGSSKLDSAEARIHDLNPHTKIERFDTRLSSDNALEILRDFDIVVD